MNYEYHFKRLLVLNEYGIYLQAMDGHVWIHRDPESDLQLEIKHFAVNNKIYGGYIEALNVIDKALMMDGQPPLIAQWEEWDDNGCFDGLMDEGFNHDSVMSRILPKKDRNEHWLD